MIASVLAIPILPGGCPLGEKIAYAEEANTSGTAVLEQAERLYANIDYEAAYGAASRLLQKGGLSHEHLSRVERLLFLSSTILGRAAEARGHAIRLLMTDPEFQLPAGSSPKFEAPFFEARAYWREQPVRPGLEVVAVTRDANAPVLRITLRDPERAIARVSVGHRWGVVGGFTKTPAKLGESASVVLPAQPVGASRLDYYVTAYDSVDSVVFEHGNELAPKTTTQEPAAEASPKATDKGGRSVFASPVFWAVSAAVLAAGGVTAYLVASRETTTTIRPTSLSELTPALKCSDGKCN